MGATLGVAYLIVTVTTNVLSTVIYHYVGQRLDDDYEKGKPNHEQ